jgi:DJ-1 family protein
MGTVYVFLADGFEEIEAFAAIDIIRRAGLKVQVISVTSDEIVKGSHDIPVLCDKNIDSCDFFDAALLLLPGGMPGAATLAECKELGRLLQDFSKQGKPIAAICAAPMVLGKLGILKGRRATCYPGFESYLEGAQYTAALIEKDGNIITGKGPGAAFVFAFAVVEFLLGQEVVNDLKHEMCIVD